VLSGACPFVNTIAERGCTLRDELLSMAWGYLCFMKIGVQGVYQPRNYELALGEFNEADLSGRIRLMVDYWRVSPDPQYSDILDNPSWDDVLLSVDRMLGKCQSDYVFLEEIIRKEPDEEGVSEVELGFGS